MTGQWNSHGSTYNAVPMCIVKSHVMRPSPDKHEHVARRSCYSTTNPEQKISCPVHVPPHYFIENQEFTLQ